MKSSWIAQCSFVLTTLTTAFAAPLEQRQLLGIDLDISGGSDGASIDSDQNNNAAPPDTIYPQKAYGDAPYSQSEDALRSAIYIPSSFNANSGKQPTILIPGTAIPAGTTFTPNLIPLLQNSDFADPLWVNIPNATLGDIQVNAEYVAYALNYVQSVTGKQGTVVTWSQGSLDTQWALKYWPSTRDTVTDFVGYSPDFDGTTNALAFCNGITNIVGCTPSVYQQLLDSDFIETLRGNDGDSAYVPTTTIYSETDEIVQPQSGTGASGYIEDARNIGVSNTDLQQTCLLLPAGTIVTHEGVLYNALAFALLKDAMTHDGPADLDRIDDLGATCLQVTADTSDTGLVSIAETEALYDLIGTEATLGVAGLNILAYQPKVFEGPPIMAYAQN